MLHRKRSQMGVGDQIAYGLAGVKHSLEDHPMFIRRLDDSDVRLSQPLLNSLHGFLKGERVLVQSGVCRDANEGFDYRPTQAEQLGAA